jgi:hypothetical protein
VGGTSTIYAYETALAANLASRANLAGVQILTGPPSAGQAQHGEFLMLGNANATQTYKTFPYNAPTAKDETFTIDLLIDVVQAMNTDQSTVTARAFALLAEVENELRSNPSQGVAYVLWSEVARSQRVEKAMNPDSGWRETLLRATVFVRARI